uniref:Bromo domain-containing protein n=1 Tax=Kalanchoe fedtschenkoi TaxID=63787 RepID=A0A7N0U466_KALFE
MIKRKRGRPKKLDPVRGEDLMNGNLANNVRSVFDEFDNAAANAINHQDIPRDAVRGSLVDDDDANLHIQNSHNKYASAFVIDTLVDTVIKRLAERGHPSGHQLSSGKLVEAGYRVSSGRKTSVLEKLPQRGQASSSALHHKVNGEIAHNRPPQMELQTRNHDCEYKQQELDRAKAVIAEVMGMHAAVPFNTPVDPIALGIPDYFDIVDTPMDFSTIYNNIENGVKYKNSDDILQDVEHIWKSCRQYYSKGDHIMDLMELVKKNFIKCWTSAGLHNKPERAGEPKRVLTKASMEPITSNIQQLQQDVFEQTLQVYGQSNLPDCPTPRPQLPIPGDDLGTDCADSLMKHKSVMDDGLQQDRDHSDHDTDERSDSLRGQSKANQHVLQPQQATGNYNHTYCPSSANEEESPTQHLANEDISCPDPAIDPYRRDNDHVNGNHLGHLTSSLDSQGEGGSVVPHAVLENTPNYSQTNELQPCFDALLPYPLPSDGDAGSSDFSSKKRRTRGPTKCLYVWSRREDKRIFVPINKLGEPIGSKAAKLSNFLGTIARDGRLVPLSYITWKKVPAEIQEKIWRLVQSKFDFDSEIRGWVFRNLATKFANWKAHLKSKHYNPHQTDEERLADRDKRVLPDQWQHLINFWNSEESQKQSERNKANRAKVKFCHTSGTKSFARLSEERAKHNGKEPTKAELFILTRTRKDGQPVNESSSMAISQLREKLAQLPDTVQNDDCVDDILFETIGQTKRSRTRISGRVETLTMASEIKRAAEEEVSQMRQKMELMEQKYKHMESLMNKVLSNIETSSTNEQVCGPATLLTEDAGAPGSPIDQIPTEQLPEMLASSEL